MLQNLHQTPEEIIKSATPEQRLIWNYVFQTFGTKVGISQFVYIGASGGSQLLTYLANKMYLAYQFQASVANGAILAAGSYVTLYNQVDAIYYTLYGLNPVYWNDTGAVMGVLRSSTEEHHNLLFSRVAVTGFAQISFIGYRLNI